MKLLRKFLLFLLPLLSLPFNLMAGTSLLYRRIGTDCGLSNNQSQYVEQLPDGRMLFVTWRGVNIYDGARVMAYPRQDERTFRLPHSHFSYDVAVDKYGLVWVKEYGRLWCFDLERREMRGDIAGLFGAKDVIDVYFDHVGRAWLLTEKSIIGADGKESPLPCKAEDIACVAVEGEKILLFMLDGSVRIAGQKPIRSAFSNDSKIEEFHIFRTNNGSYYRNIYTKGKARIDEFNPATMSWSPIMESTMILYGMAQPDDNHLEVGCRHGLVEIQLQKAADTDECPLHGMAATTLSSNSITYRPTRFYPSFCLDDGTTMQDVGVRNMCTDRRGGIWLAMGNDGVLYSHPLRHRFASAKEPQVLAIPDSVVWNCHLRLSALFHFTEQRDNDNLTDSRGNKWRATHNGIIIRNTDDSLRVTTADGLPSDFVQSFVEDKRGRVWVGTNRGICCVTSISPLQIVNYGIHDGVPQWDATASSAVMLDDGRIAMQFEQGWVTFHPDSVQHPAVSLTPTLTSAPATTLRYFENNVTLTFTTDYYAFPQSVRYLWRVNGGEWQHGDVESMHDGQLHLNFMQLHHGKYTIEVKAATDGSNFDGTACTFTFTILPPWWQTWWAYTLYIIGVIAVATFFIRRHYRRKQERLEQQMREESLLKQIETLMQAAKESVEQVHPQEEEKEDTDEEKSEKKSEEKEEELSAEDSEFVQRAITFVHQHLADDYSVEQLASDLCMERTGLYKRLTALVNQSPQIFIRSIRLNRAVEMMKRGESITNAAYAAGFNSVSYFGRCFSKEFGCSPSEYLKK